MTEQKTTTDKPDPTWDRATSIITRRILALREQQAAAASAKESAK